MLQQSVPFVHEEKPETYSKGHEPENLDSLLLVKAMVDKRIQATAR